VRNNIINWVGMDVHADSIQVAVYRGNESFPCEEYASPTDAKAKARLLKKLREMSGEVQCVYEAGPCGYDMQRFLSGNGISCEITAPALIPKKAGDRVKNQQRLCGFMLLWTGVHILPGRHTCGSTNHVEPKPYASSSRVA